MLKKFLIVILGFMGILFLSGCTTTQGAYPGLTSKAPAKTVMAQEANIASLDEVAACVAPAVRGKRVSLTEAVDNTNKGNAVSDAGTGNFVPGKMVSNYAISFLEKAGMTVATLNNISGESIQRQLVDPKKLGELQRNSSKKFPDYYLEYTTLTLDFDRSNNGSLMVKGIGFYSEMQRATLSGGVSLVKTDGSRDIAGYGGMKFSVYSTQNGLNVGRVFGNTLVTGDAGIKSQQPMQLWTGEYVVPLSTAIAVTKLPGVRKRCKDLVANIVQADPVKM